jgi:hypothetical protein
MSEQAKFEQRQYENKAVFSSEVKRKLKSGLPDVIDALIYEAKHSRNSQARVAAARQLLRLSYVSGVLEKNEFGDFLQEFGSELDKVGL